jgi:hypothetical protein
MRWSVGALLVADLATHARLAGARLVPSLNLLTEERLSQRARSFRLRTPPRCERKCSFNGRDITSRGPGPCSPTTRLNALREPVVVARQHDLDDRVAAAINSLQQTPGRPRSRSVANGQVSLSLSKRAGLAPAAAWSGAGIGCDLALIEHAAKRSSPSGFPLRAGAPGGGRRR